MEEKQNGKKLDKPPQQATKSEDKPLQQRPKVFGPVANLEEYVSSDWWKKIFNPLYLKTDGDVVDDQRLTKDEVSLIIEALKPKKDEEILDLCCGQGRHTIELARRGFLNVEGLDRSHYLIYKAKTLSKKEGLNIKFKEGDARKLPYPPDTFDIVIILGNSFGYFESIKDDIKVLYEVFRILKPWGRLLIELADGEYLKTNFNPRSWEWMDKNHFVCRERSLSLDGQRLISREVITDVEKGVIADQFYAERLYTKDDISNLLKNANFSNISFNGNGISAISERNQDLGMMEKRMLITADVRKEWTQIKRSKKIGLNIAVLLGDPTKPDILKPDYQFDDDDFYTIDQLKSALRELSQYQFTYLNSHNTIVSDLLKIIGKTDLVLNLCDEGYNNDARKELHIPSLLEVLGLSYTGSGPQCLAFCYDKSLVRGVAFEMGVPVPDAFFIKPGDSIFELTINFPVIVKPNFGDSSFGITQRSVVNNIDELTQAILWIREKFGYEKPILVEKFLTGKDISVGIIGNPPDDYNILPIIEEDYSELPPDLPRICGYEAKWLPNSPYYKTKSIRAEISDETKDLIIDSSLKLFERLECRDYCRFDWRFDDKGNPKLLEVNPNPGWCYDGHLAKMASISGISYPFLLDAIIKAGLQRLGIH
ncbi:MAG: methyltransferase domain-containing protein [bacterium]